jgi:predicted peptidase
VKTKLIPQLFEHKLARVTRTRYLLFLPAGYQNERSRRWPLILFLHGAGERGTNLKRVTTHGPPKIAQEQEGFPFIVVSPQCPNGEFWSKDGLLPLLDHVEKQYRVDRRRVYLTGLSMGGFGTWDLAMAYPHRFAAIAPICGGGDVLSLLLTDRIRQQRIRKLPVWVFHGAKDPVVPLTESERMIAALRELGNKPKVTIYPEAEHDSWTETYQNPALYNWFLQHQQRRPARAS